MTALKSWSPFCLEHGRAAYRADFILYGLLAMAMATTLLAASPEARHGRLALQAAAGLAGWSLSEYLLHRFVLHGLRPFSAWHAEHHRRPAALIGLPTPASAALISLLVLLPAWWFVDAWTACAVGFGFVVGYLGYTGTHHLTHHVTHHLTHPVGQRGGRRPGWLLERRRWHAMHHAVCPGLAGMNYGVTSSIWDRLLGTARVSTRRNSG